MSELLPRRWQLWNESQCCGELVMFALDVSPIEAGQLAGLLSGDERERASRFLAASHGQRFTVAHARLRQLLAPPLGLAPELLEFAVGSHGKPELAGAASTSGLRFNLSHSDGVGLAGWSWNARIGVDVEVWRPMRDQGALVSRYFSPAEIAAWRSLPEADRQEGFFNIWVRKEAYIKGLGLGLSLPLASFDVSHESIGGNLLRKPADSAGDGRVWSLTAPESVAGVSVAVALEAGFCHIRPLGRNLEY